jgi:hypothetical protein
MSGWFRRRLFSSWSLLLLMKQPSWKELMSGWFRRRLFSGWSLLLLVKEILLMGLMSGWFRRRLFGGWSLLLPMELLLHFLVYLFPIHLHLQIISISKI